MKILYHLQDYTVLLETVLLRVMTQKKRNKRSGIPKKSETETKANI